ncbi:hypothetical protein OIDMADRAFT_173626 [Oidiodendron maius Zn]|uniref:Zn(2)-C6 fungal-type domain-containing protein n=1 Tax=Oidiodendron maius (strain Zn) TaxID=913774 RepID=A0A0C3GN20_OIDMZ|nr:hypothetical protein OIDMADRAFT_173626 [Oidiodendron maius Zn]
MAAQLCELHRKRIKVRQACDCCHNRKIRCDATKPCGNCEVGGLLCILDNKGFQPSPLVPIDVIERCVNAFFTNRYLIMPILNRHHVYATLSHLHDSPEQYGLITALCAVVMIQPELLQPVSGGDLLDLAQAPSTEIFIQETLRARQFFNFLELPSLASVQTSFFLFAALFALDRDRTAWHYLREAIALLQTQRLDEEATYAELLDEKYATSCRRTFWLLFITERAYALQRNHQLTIKRTIGLPTVNPGPEANILHGFLDLIYLFQNFDERFLSLWNLSSTDSDVSPHCFIQLQNTLEVALPQVFRRTDVQKADLFVTRQWLKAMVWRLCLFRKLLSSGTANECMTFNYPIAIARGIAVVSSILPTKAFEVNGVGILEKVFDIGCSLADVLLLYGNSIPISGREVGPRDYLIELVRILGTVLDGSSKYLGLLVAKANDCLHVRIRVALGGCKRSGQGPWIEHRKDYNDSRSKAFKNNMNAKSTFDPPPFDNSKELESTAIADQCKLSYPHPQICWPSELNSSLVGSGNVEYQICDFFSMTD